MVERLRAAILHPKHWYSPGSMKAMLTFALACLSFVAVYAIFTRTLEANHFAGKVEQLQSQTDSLRQESACRAAASNAVFIAIGNNVDGLSDQSVAIGDLVKALIQRKFDPAAITLALDASRTELTGSKGPLREALAAQAAALTTCKDATKASNEQSGH